MNRFASPLSLCPLVLFALAGTAGAQVSLERVSIVNGIDDQYYQGTPNGASSVGFTTPDGRWTTFVSSASNIVTGDTNSASDVFVRDRLTWRTVRISVPTPTLGGQADSASTLSFGGGRVMSDDGRFVIFESQASNLVAGDTNSTGDVFVHDRDFDRDGIFDEAGSSATRTTRVSLSSTGTQATGGCPGGVCSHYSTDGVISADGRFVAWSSEFDFTADPSAFANVYWRDRDSDNDGLFDESGAVQTKLVSLRPNASFNGAAGDGASSSPALSADGRHVAFQSFSRYMVFTDSASNSEIFLRDMTGNAIQRISSPPGGGQPDGSCGSPSISANGAVVAFATNADNLVPGVAAAFQNIVVVDRDSDHDGVLDDSPIEYDCVSRYRQAFVIPGQSPLANLNGNSYTPTVSDDGRYVGFSSDSTNFAICAGVVGQPTTPECTDTSPFHDIFVYDRTADVLTRASVSRFGTEPNAHCYAATLSPNGRWVTFVSAADNMGPTDLDVFTDTFVRAMEPNDHDTCASAEPISMGSSVVSDNAAASNEGSNPCVREGRAVWYSMVADCTGTAVVDTMGSGFDTTLIVYEGGCPGGAAVVACNDDSGAWVNSSVTFDVDAGQTYMIRVGGYVLANGVFVLNVSPCDGPCPADWDHDDDVDSDDVILFFADWEGGSGDVDGDSDGDSDDVIAFFESWDGGC